MTARPKLAPEQQMTIEEFLAFTDTRPEEERWELIEGVPVLNPSPIDYHQMIVPTLWRSLMRSKRRDEQRSWLPLLGVGTRVPVSPHSLPQPDVIVKEAASHRLSGIGRCARAVRGPLEEQHQGRPGLAAAGLCQRAELPALRHRVAQGRSRSSPTIAPAIGMSAPSPSLDERLALPALDLAIPLADIYRWTPLGQSDTQ